MAGLLSRFFGRTASEGAAFALGLATGPVLYPAVRELEQEANRIYPTAALDAGTAAGIVAEDVEQRDWGASEAAAHGIDGTRFDAMLGEALNAPGLPELLALWRRGLIDTAGFEHGLRKAKLETRWDTPVQGLHDVLLTPAELANARQQGYIDQGRQHEEAGLQGVTDDRAEVQFQMVGLPPGPETLQRAANRGFIDQGTFVQGIREGHTKTKYADLLWQLRVPVLSAATAVRLYLKGWYTKAERDAVGAEWGYTSQQMEDWFLSEGRPATVHQVHIGYARGARLPGAANEEEAIRLAVKESDIRPEYADLLYAQRYTYPSAFVLRGLVESGALSRQDGEEALLFSGWEPTFAAKVAASWAGQSGGTATDAHLSKAQTTAWTKAQTSYLARESTASDVAPIFAALGVPDAARTEILALWDQVRALIHAQLSPTQVKKAVKNQVANPATGVPWTFADGLQALMDRGYTRDDATTLLNE